MNIKTAFISIALMLLLVSCGSKAVATPSVDMYAPGVGGGAPEMGFAPLPAATQSLSDFAEANRGIGGDATTASGTAIQERMVMMNADLTIVVPDPQVKVETINQMATSLGGHVVSLNMYQTYTQAGDTVPEGYISIRVPADKLENALGQIKSDAVEVRNETRTGTDVTASYVDLQSQLTNLEQAEQDLLQIMDDAKNNPGNDSTTRTQDVLNVYNQIVGIRGQIESIKGQMQYYEESSSTSLINVTLIAEETVKPLEIGGWKPEGVARDAIQSLIKFWQGFVNFLIGLFLLVIPILITIFGPLALIIWAVIALIRRRRRISRVTK